MSDSLPAGLGEYLAGRAAERVAKVTQMYENLTERERLLVKEAAVMGWVQGVRHHDVPIPHDRDLLMEVLDAARAFSDLYPTLAALETP